MAPHSQIILSTILISFTLFTSSRAAGIATYWGQDLREGSLAEACAADSYEFVNIAFLNTFGGGKEPLLNLAGHCDHRSGTCARFSDEIKSCQGRGIKVLLSLGGQSGGYSLSSADDAGQVAEYLWNNFLGGTSNSRPLGDAVLDGIDFDIEAGGTQYWEDLARALSGRSSAQRKVYLSAAPQCPIPDAHLDTAIQTELFDYIWVQFYNNAQCDYRAGVDGIVDRWNQWTAVRGSKQVFLGLPASEEAVSPEQRAGYTPPDVLINQILPRINNGPKYGGVMLWNRFFDKTYSQAIKGSI